MRWGSGMLRRCVNGKSLKAEKLALFIHYPPFLEGRRMILNVSEIIIIEPSTLVYDVVFSNHIPFRCR